MSQDSKEIERVREAAMVLLRRYGRRIPAWSATEVQVGPFHLLLGRVDAATEALDIMYGPDTVATWHMRADQPPAVSHFEPGTWCDALLRLNGGEELTSPHLD